MTALTPTQRVEKVFDYERLQAFHDYWPALCRMRDVALTLASELEEATEKLNMVAGQIPAGSADGERTSSAPAATPSQPAGMPEPQRWRLGLTDGLMHPRDGGEYVYYYDYKALRAHASALQRKVEERSILAEERETQRDQLITQFSADIARVTAEKERAWEDAMRRAAAVCNERYAAREWNGLIRNAAIACAEIVRSLTNRRRSERRVEREQWSETLCGVIAERRSGTDRRVTGELKGC